MKLLAILLVILCHNQNVSANPIFEFMVTALTEVASTLTNSLKALKNKIKTLFSNNSSHVISQNHIAEKVKIKTLSDVVGKIPLREGTQDSVNRRLKSETFAELSTPQMILRHGRRMQTHIVLTLDGYLLTLHRIMPSPDTSNNSSNTHRTVILHHGLLGSSADWILLGPKKSLPYLLSDDGYDVWMVNARGNCYSRSHFSLKVDSAEFWKFSWQEMGEYDLPAVIDYIRKFKNSTDPINFIGHSMGATVLLVLLSSKPHYNRYLRIGILLAPLAFMTNVDGPLKFLATVASSPPDEVMDVLGADEFLASKKIPDYLINKYCNSSKIFCSNSLFFISGGIPENGTWEAGFLERLLHHVPAGGSTNTVLHYAQVANNKKFHKFHNIDAEFPLGQITLPIALFSSSGDWLSTIPDVWRLYLSIGRPIENYVIQDRNISHTEFVWGWDADELVFNKVMGLLETDPTLVPLKANEVNVTL